jgi:hypothetical protein
LRIHCVTLGGDVFCQARGAQMLWSRAHPHVALAGIVRDEQEPYFHFAVTDRASQLHHALRRSTQTRLQQGELLSAPNELSFTYSGGRA